MTIEEILNRARDEDCSDLHLTMDLPPIVRKLGSLTKFSNEIDSEENRRLILSMINEEQRKRLDAGEDLDFAYADALKRRYRVNIYHQKGQLAAAIRLLREDIPTLEELHLPEVFKDFAMLPRGLVLITGPTGSGKSTSLAAITGYINAHRNCHVITVEDPIEYEHHHRMAMIHQRELGVDAPSYEQALRAALREDPDVILVGEMRDFETISAALTAAETGHLVFSTLHTIGAANTIDRIIDVFPPHQQQQVRIQLASVLKGVATQQILPKADGTGRTAAFEIMVANDAISNMIRESKGHQIPSAIQTGRKQGMILLDASLAQLVEEGVITLSTAMEKCTDKEQLKKFLEASASIFTNNF